jgi:hypothetical protein
MVSKYDTGMVTPVITVSIILCMEHHQRMYLIQFDTVTILKPVKLTAPQDMSTLMKTLISSRMALVIARSAAEKPKNVLRVRK